MGDTPVTQHSLIGVTAAPTNGFARRTRGREAINIRLVFTYTVAPTGIIVLLQRMAFDENNNQTGLWVNVGGMFDNLPALANGDTVDYPNAVPQGNYGLLRLRLDTLTGGTNVVVDGYIEFGGS